jgi:hypothetical protein
MGTNPGMRLGGFLIPGVDRYPRKKKRTAVMTAGLSSRRRAPYSNSARVTLEIDTALAPDRRNWIRQCARPASAATQLRYQAGIQPRSRLWAVSRFRMSSSGCWRSHIKSSGKSNVRTHSKYASHGCNRLRNEGRKPHAELRPEVVAQRAKSVRAMVLHKAANR